MNARYACSITTVLMVLCRAGLAMAQTPAEPAQPQPAAPPPPPATPAPEAAAPVAPAPKAAPMVGEIVNPLKVETPNASIRLGLLLQPQYEAIGNALDNGITNNLYLRRTRVLLGGSLLKYFEYFLDTDYPNLFKSATVTPAGGPPESETVKSSPGLNIQDAYATFKPLAGLPDTDRSFRDYVKLDAGFMLPPLAHNAVQGATTLYGWDYFANSFRSTGSFHNAAPDPVGRDLGVQLRGLVLWDHLEYRLGLFQGIRDNPVLAAGGNPAEVGSRNFFRMAARLQVNILDPEPGFFYAGTYLGAKKILSVGGSYDFQDNYKYWAVDGFLDLPAGPGVVTAQVNVAQWSGGTFIPALPTQTAIMGEAGYLIAPIALSPILRYERLLVMHGQIPDETRYVAGLAYWPFGHNINVKAFYSRIQQSNGVHDYDRFNLQWQLFFY